MILPQLCLIIVIPTPLNLREFLGHLHLKVPCHLIQDPKRTMSKSPSTISTIIDARFDIDATILSTGRGSAASDLADR
jgi:hypothetical protein